jgi:hypothetical protein
MLFQLPKLNLFTASASHPGIHPSNHWVFRTVSWRCEPMKSRPVPRSGQPSLQPCPLMHVHTFWTQSTPKKSHLRWVPSFDVAATAQPFTHLRRPRCSKQSSHAPVPPPHPYVQPMASGTSRHVSVVSFTLHLQNFNVAMSSRRGRPQRCRLLPAAAPCSKGPAKPPVSVTVQLSALCASMPSLRARQPSPARSCPASRASH